MLVRAAALGLGGGVLALGATALLERDNNAVVLANRMHRTSHANSLGGAALLGVGLLANQSNLLPQRVATSMGVAGALLLTTGLVAPFLVDAFSRPAIAAVGDQVLAEARGEVVSATEWFRSQGVTRAELPDLEVKWLGNRPGAHYDGKVAVGIDQGSGEGYGTNDIVAHKLAHRFHVTNWWPARGSVEQGAIAESFADTIAVAYDSEDWTVGEDTGTVTRDVEHPSSVPMRLGPVTWTPPEHKKDWKDLNYGPVIVDGGGVHLNAGIPDRAAFLIGDRLGREVMARIYLEVGRTHLNSATTMQSYAEGVLEVTSKMFGAGSTEAAVVKDAWEQVGYKVG